MGSKLLHKDKKLFLVFSFLTLLHIPSLSVGEPKKSYDEMFPIDSSQENIAPGICLKGSSTFLEKSVLTRSLRLDGHEGKTTFLMRSSIDKSLLWSQSVIGMPLCLGNNAEKSSYVVGILRQQGATVGLSQIYFIDEKRKALISTSYAQKDYHSLATVMNSNSTYMAFVSLLNDSPKYLFGT